MCVCVCVCVCVCARARACEGEEGVWVGMGGGGGVRCTTRFDSPMASQIAFLSCAHKSCDIRGLAC